MRAEDTLQYMADFYSDIFPTRKHCLDFLFCVVGNGYEWVNGELISEDDKYEKRYKLRHPIEKAEFKKEAEWVHMNKLYAHIKELDNTFNIPLQYRFSWYPLSKKYSALFTAPEDIKEDWKILLEECKQLLLENGIDINNCVEE